MNNNFIKSFIDPVIIQNFWEDVTVTLSIFHP